MMTPNYYIILVLLLINILLLTVCACVFLRGYKQTKSKINLLLMCSFILSSLSLVPVMIIETVFDENTQINLIFTYFSIGNVLIVFGVSLLSITFYYIIRQDICLLSVFSSIAAGALLIFLLDTSKTTVVYNKSLNMWTTDYSKGSFYMYFIIQLILLLPLLQILYYKIVLQIRKKKIDGGFFGLVFVSVWYFTTFIKKPILHHPIMRNSIIALIGASFILSVYTDPLAFHITKEVPSELIIVNEAGKALFHYNFENKIINGITKIELLRRSEILLEKNLETELQTNFVKIGNYEIHSLLLGTNRVIIQGKNLDININRAIYFVVSSYFLDKKITDFEDAFKDKETVKTFTQKMLNTLKNVCLNLND